MTGDQVKKFGSPAGGGGEGWSGGQNEGTLNAAPSRGGPSTVKGGAVQTRSDIPIDETTIIPGVRIAQERKRPDSARRGNDLDGPPTPEGAWPVVDFRNGVRMLLTPLDFNVENANGEIEATRNQVPLILAWA